MGSEIPLIVMNFGVCSVGGFLAMCRMTKMSASRTKLAIRWQYVLWFCAFCVSGWSFAFGDPASIVQLIMSLILLGIMCLGIQVWRHGAPEYTRVA